MKINKTYYLLLFFLTVIIIYSSCKNKNNKIGNDKILASVYDKNLYYSDIRNMLEYNQTPEDSQIFVNRYIKKWINNQLLLKKAEVNLSDEELDVSKQIEKYKDRLIINKYEQKIIYQKLDTNVSISEITDYYNKYSNNFKIKEPIVKAVFMKLHRNTPNIWKARKWFKSNDEKDIEKTTIYAHDNAIKFKDFDGNWINIKLLENNIDIKKPYTKKYILERDYFEIGDSLNVFFVKIEDRKIKGDISPLELVKNNIKKIIITKRKQELIERVKKDIYNDAIEKNKIKIFENKTQK